ncbi:MAG: Holliday junction branch migration protein RuvA [Gemmatimonadetes bacterium]|nr:Holliday junction branch migration protein RuvA [Gemmatimonadota bacterium]NIR79899.1 Holliday junction branch migration protein RuvA [Gemmatimonadota bacterium]NIT88618.1 Holliday junction branch migration protein RuvA [Gemmatimonadota bacterium]NIU32433.1 Holliday junction branch migration protein RuvA [Gemmatimonadota bacterium]NIU36929.1 Holliday junction branch migration protein RuvA [Gemmatimonadota bacterium]
MISRLKGTLLAREMERIEVETGGGVVYEVWVPLSIVERLPPVGRAVEIRTYQVVREDSVALYGFLEPHERELFGRLLNAQGLGAAKALNMLSTYSARRLARALVEKDLAALTQVTGIGKKTAQKIALELADKVEDLAVGPEGAEDAADGSREAVSALVSLGYSFPEADRAVRQALEDGRPEGTEELIRRALATRE